MSLVGSLEDLSLGDILQIISLSQKSGVLALDTHGCGGRIVFSQGLVRGAVIKDGPRDLRGVLVEGGFLSAEAFDTAEQAAADEGGDIAAVVAATTELSSERIDSLCREAVEAAVCTMFTWRVGDFSFDVRSEPEPEDPQLLLPTGINAQFLAMEAARVRDEGGREDEASGGSSPAPSSSDTAFDEMPAEEMFGVVDVDSPTAEPEPIEIVEQASGLPAWGEDASPGRDAVDALAQATLERVDAEDESGDEPPELDPTHVIEELEAVLAAAEASLQASSEPEEPPLVEPMDAPDDAPLLEADALDEPEWVSEPIPSDDEDVLPVDEVATPVEIHADPALEDTAPVLEAPMLEPILEHDEPDVVTARAEKRPGAPDEPSDVPMVVVDPDLVALEWIKYSLKDSYEQVHIFQGSEQGLARVRQYLVRGQPPVVLLSPAVQVDTLSGIRDPADFIARLKAQSPKIHALWLCEEGGAGASGAPADGAVKRPPHRQLTLGGTTPEHLEELAKSFAAKLRAEVARIAERSAPEKPRFRERRSQGVSRDVLERLRDATRALTEASSRGEVLPLVIRFAAETFSRVAMFMVRGGVATGMAQHGLGRCGGPDDDALRDVQVQTDSSAWLRTVLESRKSIQGSPDDEGDRLLAGLLGDRLPPSAYVAPIESAGQVIALLYGDNLPDEDPIGDTSSLEVVMHHAGLALDRAALERALVEGESDA